MHKYSSDLKIQDALQIYFSNYHFSNGGYNDKYFRIKIGPLYIPIPNTQARIDAVKFHDIHHILTEYNALWKGEIEIAAWELSSGCGKFYVAWILNSGSFLLGLLLYPRSLFRAFKKGGKIKSNLYKGYTYDERLVERTVGQLREELGIELDNYESAQTVG